MQCAASQGHIHIVKLLVDTHGDVETLLPEQNEMEIAKSRRARYPFVSGPVMEALYAVAYGGHEVIFRFLADLLYLREYGPFESFRWELYRFAVMGGHDVILDELYQLPKPKRNNFEDTPEDRPLLNCRLFGAARATWHHLFQYGVAFGDERAVRRALEYGIDVSKKYNRRFIVHEAPALVHASRYGHQDIVYFLLEEGAGQQTEDVQDATIMASRRGFTPVVQLLLECQSNDSSVNKVHLMESSFQSAAKYGQVHVIELLVSLVLHVDRNSGLMRSAISVALERGYSCVARTVERLGESGGWQETLNSHT